MAYITHKQIKGITYYYAEEREWREGRSRRKWQKYLGLLSKIKATVDGLREKPQYAQIFELGCLAPYFNIAHELMTIDIFNKFLQKRRQGLRTGFYLTLAAVNRENHSAVSKMDEVQQQLFNLFNMNDYLYS